MRALVTGARGFVGRHVVAALHGAGIDVRILTRAPASRSEPDVVSGDVREPRVAEEALRDVDAVVHLAARVHVMRERAADPLAEFRAANVEPTIALADAARQSGAHTFIFASSVKAVGESTTRPWTRATIASPVDPYGISKREAEIALARIAATSSIHVVPLRFPLLYGPGMKGNMLALMRLVDRGLPVPVSTRANARSLLYVGNAATAIAHLVATGAPAATGEPYFLSDGAPTTRQLVREIGEALHRRALFVPIPAAPARGLAQVADTILGGGSRVTSRVDRLFGSLEVDSSDFVRDFAFSFPYTRIEGLSETARWLRQERPA